jgi:uncharacterized protein DUF4270
MTILKTLRKELLFFLSFTLLAIVILPGCQKQPNLLFGNSYTDLNSGANIVLVDTATVKVSTVFVDSVPTANTDYIMVGSYNDAYTGVVTSRAFLQVAPAALPAIDPRIDTYDSIGMLLFFKPGNPYYGDTTQFQTYVVNQVDTLFQEQPFQTGWYSSYSLPLGPIIGRSSVRIEPNRPVANSSNNSQGTGDTVRIRMDDNLGRQLFNMIYNKSDSVFKSDQFLNWFHGLCISPDPTLPPAGIINGFRSDTCYMRIYYRENAVISTEKFIDFPITNKSRQFTALSLNRTGKPIEKLITPTQPKQTPPATPSGLIGNAGYVQSINGLNVKLTFPYLGSVALRRDYVGLLRAQLIVRPVPGSFSQIWRLPPQVGIYVTDLSNTILGAVPSVSSSGLQSGNLFLDYFNPLNTAYTYDVTSFVQAQLINASPAAQETGLLLDIPAPANVTSFNRLVVADQSYPVSQQVTLRIYYISLYPHQ